MTLGIWFRALHLEDGEPDRMDNRIGGRSWSVELWAVTSTAEAPGDLNPKSNLAAGATRRLSFELRDGSAELFVVPSIEEAEQANGDARRSV